MWTQADYMLGFLGWIFFFPCLSLPPSPLAGILEILLMDTKGSEKPRQQNRTHSAFWALGIKLLWDGLKSQQPDLHISDKSRVGLNTEKRLLKLGWLKKEMDGESRRRSWSFLGPKQFQLIHTNSHGIPGNIRELGWILLKTRENVSESEC